MKRSTLLCRSALFAAAIAMSMAGCGHSGSSISFAPPTASLPAGGSTITLVLGQTAQVTVTEPQPAGAFDSISSDPTVVTVTPPTLAAASKRAQIVAQSSGTFLLSAVGIGSASVTIGDSLGSHVNFNVSVVAATAGTPVPSASLVNLTVVGQTQTITVAQSGYSGTFTASSQNPSVATVSGSGPFSITAVAAGTTMVTFTNTQGGSASVTVIVTITSGVIF